MEKNEILFIIGNSGSGKSYITSKLTEYPLFYRMLQYTTRAKRDTERGDEYYFITKEHYDLISDRLMSTTIVNDEYYGTVPVYKEDAIGIVVVNRLGLENGIKFLEDKQNVDYRVLYIKNTEPFEKRQNRNEEFVRKEMEETKEIIEKIDSDKLIEIENNPSNRTSLNNIRYLICKSFNKPFTNKKVEENKTNINCPWVTCIHNNLFKCTKDSITLTHVDCYLEDDVINIDDVEDIEELKSEQSLRCEDYKLNPYWYEVNAKFLKNK